MKRIAYSDRLLNMFNTSTVWDDTIESDGGTQTRRLGTADHMADAQGYVKYKMMGLPGFDDNNNSEGLIVFAYGNEDNISTCGCDSGVAIPNQRENIKEIQQLVTIEHPSKDENKAVKFYVKMITSSCRIPDRVTCYDVKNTVTFEINPYN